MPTVQVVVDAQEGYLRDALLASTRASIVTAVRRSAEEGVPTVILEMFEWDFPAAGQFSDDYRAADGKYWHPGKTIREVQEVVASHQHLFDMRSKRCKNGADKVLASCAERGLMPSRFLLCGGFLDGCLYSTALGLLCSVPGCEVEIAGEAVFLNRVCAWMELFGLPWRPRLLRMRRTEPVLPLFQGLLEQLSGFANLAELTRLTTLLRIHPDKPLTFS